MAAIMAGNGAQTAKNRARHGFLSPRRPGPPPAGGGWPKAWRGRFLSGVGKKPESGRLILQSPLADHFHDALTGVFQVV